MSKTAALCAAVFKLFTKNLMRGVQTPPSGARVKALCCSRSVEVKQVYKHFGE